MQFQSLGQEDPLEKGTVIHTSILTLKIPWTEEPGWLQSMASQRVGHDWVTTYIYIVSKYLYIFIFIFKSEIKASTRVCHVEAVKPLPDFQVHKMCAWILVISVGIECRDSHLHHPWAPGPNGGGGQSRLLPPLFWGKQCQGGSEVVSGSGWNMKGHVRTWRPWFLVFYSNSGRVFEGTTSWLLLRPLI